MTWRIDGPIGSESHKIRHKIVPYTRGRGLDLGPGPWKAWPHFTGIDNLDEWNDGSWQPDIRGDITDLSQFADRSLDFVYSSHVLEHLDDTEAVLREWWRVIKDDGYLVLYLPHADLYPRMGEPGANPDHLHDFLPQDIVDVMCRVSKAWDLVENEDREQGDEYSFFQVYRKRHGTGHRFSHLEQRKIPAGKRLALIRYGAFGDHIQASTVLPKLKAEGWHITYVTTPYGEDVLGNNPFIDRFWVQDTNQVPNHMLEDYWKGLGLEFDRVINLSESVEGTLLTMPGRRTHALPKPAREMLCGINYLDFVHAIAEVEGLHEPRFYPTVDEMKKLQKWLASKAGPRPAIMWALAGSSIHKVWPWTQEVVAWLLEETDATVIFVGGKMEQELEFAIYQQLVRHYFDIPFEDSNEMKLSQLTKKVEGKFPGRLVCTSGAWSIRETLTAALLCNIVVGPETGVLNAVAYEPNVAKVIMLSHSSHENLTRDWESTLVLAPEVDCYPCHRMHYSRDYCPEDENTGASICAASIAPRPVFEAINSLLKEREAA